MNGQEIVDAIDQLERSERGRAAAVGLRKMLEKDDRYLLSLDDRNWAALETLVRACRVFGAYNVIEALPKR